MTIAGNVSEGRKVIYSIYENEEKRELLNSEAFGTFIGSGSGKSLDSIVKEFLTPIVKDEIALNNAVAYLTPKYMKGYNDKENHGKEFYKPSLGIFFSKIKFKTFLSEQKKTEAKENRRKGREVIYKIFQNDEKKKVFEEAGKKLLSEHNKELRSLSKNQTADNIQKLKKKFKDFIKQANVITEENDIDLAVEDLAARRNKLKFLFEKFQNGTFKSKQILGNANQTPQEKTSTTTNPLTVSSSAQASSNSDATPSTQAKEDQAQTASSTNVNKSTSKSKKKTSASASKTTSKPPAEGSQPAAAPQPAAKSQNNQNKVEPDQGNTEAGREALYKLYKDNADKLKNGINSRNFGTSDEIQRLSNCVSHLVKDSQTINDIVAFFLYKKDKEKNNVDGSPKDCLTHLFNRLTGIEKSKSDAVFKYTTGEFLSKDDKAANKTKKNAAQDAKAAEEKRQQTSEYKIEKLREEIAKLKEERHQLAESVFSGAHLVLNQHIVNWADKIANGKPKNPIKLKENPTADEQNEFQKQSEKELLREQVLEIINVIIAKQFEELAKLPKESFSLLKRPNIDPFIIKDYKGDPLDYVKEFAEGDADELNNLADEYIKILDDKKTDIEKFSQMSNQISEKEKAIRELQVKQKEEATQEDDMSDEEMTAEALKMSMTTASVTEKTNEKPATQNKNQPAVQGKAVQDKSKKASQTNVDRAKKTNSNPPKVGKTEQKSATQSKVAQTKVENTNSKDDVTNPTTPQNTTTEQKSENKQDVKAPTRWQKFVNAIKKPFVAIYNCFAKCFNKLRRKNPEQKPAENT